MVKTAKKELSKAEQKRMETMLFCIKAIAERFSEIANYQDTIVPFNPDILKKYEITLNQFIKTVNSLEDVIREVDGKMDKTRRRKLVDEDTMMVLLEVEDNAKIRSKIWEMGEPLYNYFKGGKYYQCSFYNGKNIAFLVYHTLANNNPKLASENREKVIQGLYELPNNRDDYFRQIRLAGVMEAYSKKEKGDPVLAILKAFDKEYQDITWDKSLFDRRKKHCYNPEVKPVRLLIA